MEGWTRDRALGVVRNIALFALFVTAIIVEVACTGGKKLAASPQAGDARGTVDERPDSNGVRIAIHVHDLARPSRVSPDATVYVVWVKPLPGATGPRNIGRLTIDGDEGSLEAATPLRWFELFVTAEPSAHNTEPWGDKLLWTEIHEP